MRGGCAGVPGLGLAGPPQELDLRAIQLAPAPPGQVGQLDGADGRALQLADVDTGRREHLADVSGPPLAHLDVEDGAALVAPGDPEVDARIAAAGARTHAGGRPVGAPQV